MPRLPDLPTIFVPVRVEPGWLEGYYSVPTVCGDTRTERWP